MQWIDLKRNKNRKILARVGKIDQKSGAVKLVYRYSTATNNIWVRLHINMFPTAANAAVGRKGKMTAMEDGMEGKDSDKEVSGKPNNPHVL